MSRFDTDLVIDVFIDGFAAIQRHAGPVHALSRDGLRYLEFDRGRRGSPFTVEFFPAGESVSEVVAIAHAVAGDQPHLVSAVSASAHTQIDGFVAAGYECWGTEIVMARSLADASLEAGDERARASVTTLDGVRIEAAMRDADLRPHPVTASHLSDPELRHRLIEEDGRIAAFGRIALVRGSAYLADIVTLPAFRRRGHAAALVRALLVDAQAAGATTCVLASTEMGLPLYRSLGFTDVVPLVGFQTPGAG